MFNIQPISALTDNYIWTIANPNGQILVVDPGEARPVENYLQQTGTQLAGILVTHHHWDHTNGIAELLKKFAVPVYASAQSPLSMVSHPLQDNAQVEIENFGGFKAIAIPGHTLDHTAYYGENSVFSGDTLFASGCGRIFEGNPSMMYASLQKLKSLPRETKVYCGHEYTVKNLQFAHEVEPHNAKISERLQKAQALRSHKQPTLPSTIADEWQTNPFFRCGEPEVIASAGRYAGVDSLDELEVFTILRKWKDGF